MARKDHGHFTVSCHHVSDRQALHRSACENLGNPCELRRQHVAAGIQHHGVHAHVEAQHRAELHRVPRGIHLHLRGHAPRQLPGHPQPGLPRRLRAAEHLQPCVIHGKDLRQGHDAIRQMGPLRQDLAPAVLEDLFQEEAHANHSGAGRVAELLQGQGSGAVAQDVIHHQHAVVFPEMLLEDHQLPAALVGAALHLGRQHCRVARREHHGAPGPPRAQQRHPQQPRQGLGHRQARHLRAQHQTHLAVREATSQQYRCLVHELRVHHMVEKGRGIDEAAGARLGTLHHPVDHHLLVW
mmetsp:Transcript_56155/g.134181  ORF Transcript_56155/g.134181 Transcript_56155/m.134181 type:complete len:296 (-) Transcript_56155:465-1352(-)